ncbi:hypothetical protein CLAFUW4_06644 [Fulvia fulva]|nr:hypothetical protein CLAFUR4_06652 [Fulvia fulva]WPV16604.1 hypothetical protein CLAFUW4_06644 [Fulvia fulva]WPV31109.1 hypothetical protein CLAFUW7_06643 [Fulvia fulva]
MKHLQQGEGPLFETFAAAEPRKTAFLRFGNIVAFVPSPKQL